jgi:hypothetical protein
MTKISFACFIVITALTSTAHSQQRPRPFPAPEETANAISEVTRWDTISWVTDTVTGERSLECRRMVSVDPQGRPTWYTHRYQTTFPRMVFPATLIHYQGNTGNVLNVIGVYILFDPIKDGLFAGKLLATVIGLENLSGFYPKDTVRLNVNNSGGSININGRVIDRTPFEWCIPSTPQAAEAMIEFTW